jgi:aspartyl protease
MKRWLLLSAFVTLSVVAQAQDQVPLRLIDGWAIVVEGSVGSMTRQAMLIDTGAVPSVIDSALAKRMKLAGRPSEVSVLNQSVSAERVCVPSVQVGGTRVKNLDMVALDLGRISQALGTRIDAIIGLDLLARRNFTLDYRHRRLEFGGSINGAAAIPFEIGHEAGGIYVLVRVDSEGQRLRVLLDTGTKDLMLFPDRLRGNLNALRVRGRESNLNVGGNDQLSIVELASVSMGPFQRKRQKAFLWATANDRASLFDGLLGPKAFGASVVQFDFDRKVIAFGD